MSRSKLLKTKIKIYMQTKSFAIAPSEIFSRFFYVKYLELTLFKKVITIKLHKSKFYSEYDDVFDDMMKEKKNYINIKYNVDIIYPGTYLIQEMQQL